MFYRSVSPLRSFYNSSGCSMVLRPLIFLSERGQEQGSNCGASSKRISSISVYLPLSSVSFRSVSLMCVVTCGKGNEVMQHQLEFDLMNMSNEKRARKNALRRRVASPATPPPSYGNPGMTSSLSPVSSAVPPPPPAAELRRLTSGRSSDEWDVVSGGRTPGSGQKQERRDARGSSTRSREAGVLQGGEGPLMRDHGWVMERVKMRKRESSWRRKGRKFDTFGSVWSPSEEQVWYVYQHYYGLVFFSLQRLMWPSF